MLLNNQPVFTPKNLFNLIFWGDATQQAVGAVSSWTDQSGQGNNATQATGGLQPTCTAAQQNGKNALVFNGANSLTIGGTSILALPNGNSTVFVVANSSVNNAVERLVSIGSAANNRYNASFFSTSNQILMNNSGTNLSGTGGGFTKSAFNIFQFRRNGANMFISANNGAENTNATAVSNNDSDLATIGSTRGTTQFLTGSIAEIIIYNRALSTTEITAVNSYLSGKWAIGNL